MNQNNPQDNSNVSLSFFEKYIDKLIEEKDFPDLTPEVKEEIKADLRQRLDDFLAGRIISQLSNEDVLQFEEMLKNGKPEGEVQQFISTHIPDFTNFLSGVLLEFRSVYLGLTEAPADELSPAPEPKEQKSEENS